MHATKVLQKILSAVIARLDVRHARNLFLAVEALLVGRRLTLTELAPICGAISQLRIFLSSISPDSRLEQNQFPLFVCLR